MYKLSDSAGIAAFSLFTVLNAACQTPPHAAPDFSTTEIVGRFGSNRFYTPANQILTPAGHLVELPGLRPQALALSPNGKLLVTSGKTHELFVIAPVSGEILQQVPFPPRRNQESSPNPVSDQNLKPDNKALLSYTGLAFSPDGTRIYLANVEGDIKVFRVDAKGKVSAWLSLPLPPWSAQDRNVDIPSGLALSSDGKRLYVVLNLSNRLAEFDATTGKLLRLWDVGFAPYDVVLAGAKAYVSNWGGRRPGPDSPTGPAGLGTRVRVDPVRHIANEGSVTIISLRPIDPTPPAPNSELLTGLHASAMALSPNRRWLVIANAGSDSLTVLDTRTDRIVETISARQTPADLFGAQPDALAFDRYGRRLFVCNASQNAVAAFDFRPGKSKMLGLIPVGWFPGAIIHDSRRDTLYVANIKGLTPGRARASDGRIEYNSHQYHGSLSLVKLPSPPDLAAMTRAALMNLRFPLLQQAALPPRPGRPPQPVPERVGESSVFKHVLYIIKENRTYDQVLGDFPQGNGDPSLCVFGERVTPNQHKICRDFVLLDNTYCSGIQSSDGHQWTDTALTTDYLERSFAGYPRSYPDGMGDGEVDALAYSPTGFIWDNAIAHAKSLRDYGEFAITEAHWKDRSRTNELKFLDFYRDFTSQAGEVDIHSRPAIESLRPYLASNTVGWAMDIPDQFRAAQFIKELKAFERTGDFPNLSIMCLPNDHTSGTKEHAPTPAAQVADNDLALGQIVEAVSHSRFWPETCILVIEDDPQSGWDHVSGYRTTAYVVSPYTRRGAVVSTQYNHTSLLRTIELMLGLPPMNIFDASATPMSDCFTAQPNLAPFTALPTNIPLDEMNPEPKKISDPLLRKHAYASARLPLEAPDLCPDDQLNRILWHAMKGPKAPYPTWAVSSIDDD
jgi:DNA-binding beta-propeller fold protein YncE